MVYFTHQKIKNTGVNYNMKDTKSTTQTERATATETATRKATIEIDKAIIGDNRIIDGAFRVYCALAMLAGDDKKVSAYLLELANIAGKSTGTIRKKLRQLIKCGYITRILQKSPEIPKMNVASMFILNDNTDKGQVK